MLEIRIKNVDSVAHTWVGMEYAPGDIYTLQAVDWRPTVENIPFFDDVACGKAQIGDASQFFSNPIEGWEYLRAEGLTEIAVSELPEPRPFAAPDYRTKRNATSALTTIAAGATASVDFKLLAERYVAGGTAIIENAKLGDYFTAEVRDVDGVIPEAYRASICENWPTVATYVEREWVEVENGTITRHRVDTYPLNAKITSGLYLRLTYTAANEGSDRRIGINYVLTKKLT